MGITRLRQNYISLTKTSKFERTLKDIRIEKTILAPICATIFFFEVLALPYVILCPELQSCAIARKTDDCNLEKMAKILILDTIWGPQNFFYEFYLYYSQTCSNHHLYETTSGLRRDEANSSPKINLSLIIFTLLLLYNIKTGQFTKLHKLLM